ncbi:lytic transglycosylase domain-containing protein [Paucibacter sp. APW11]|uniref:Lytic transglycosylase domain-containing protein n=1 Tax=Roseateles aquae TaxID=3077235 RepID=A0ABU3PA33_9BURK|nr:lytic transglycosylase domain-containing protein [Paucibacter sp. APW11]MDT8998948.1 lytic transglycosylase domain-containing protein [Paucibacter sp. APW11]
MRRLRSQVFALLLLAASAAHAQLWGYVDGAGIAHFASTPLNSQYQPVLSAGAEPQAVPGKTDSSRQLLTWLEIAPEVKSVQPYLREAARASGVDMELLKAIIAVESGFKADAVSPRGATGLMQLSSDTAERYATRDEARRPAAALLRDPRSNVHIGARMLADLIRRFGRIDAALAAWNAGEGAVRRAGGRMPEIEETQAHVHMVLELYWALLQRSLPGQAQQLKIHTAAR